MSSGLVGAFLSAKTAFLREFKVSTENRRFKVISTQNSKSLTLASLESTIKGIVRAFL